MESKERKIRSLVKNSLGDERISDEIKLVLDRLNISEQEVEDAFVKYDLDVFDFENEIYESITMRAVLYLKNQIRNSWHFERQRVVLDWMKRSHPIKIVDMGFGAPSLYVKEYVFKNSDVKLTLVDLFESAFTFSEALFELINPEWSKQITFQNLDMNKHLHPGNFDLYLFQDSIEHVIDATAYIQEFVKKTSTGSHFIFSLPIGPLIPMHTINWDALNESRKWLSNAGVEIIDEKEVYLNPEGDLWAEQMNKSFYNLIALCQKL